MPVLSYSSVSPLAMHSRRRFFFLSRKNQKKKEFSTNLSETKGFLVLKSPSPMKIKDFLANLSETKGFEGGRCCWGLGHCPFKEGSALFFFWEPSGSGTEHKHRMS